MGRVICFDGSVIEIASYPGTIDFSLLIRDLLCYDYSDSYRVGLINTVQEVARKKTATGMAALNAMEQLSKEKGFLGRIAKNRIHENALAESGNSLF